MFKVKKLRPILALTNNHSHSLCLYTVCGKGQSHVIPVFFTPDFMIFVKIQKTYLTPRRQGLCGVNDTVESTQQF